MAFLRGFYFKEISIDENAVRNIHVNFQQVFLPVQAIYVLVDNKWELISGEIIVKHLNNWCNITKGEVIPIEQGNVNLEQVLVEDEYDYVLTENDYDQILY